MGNFSLELQPATPLDVRDFHIDDALSALFAVDVTAVSSDGHLDFESLIGAPAKFTVHLDAGAYLGRTARVYTGIVTEIHQLKLERSGLSTYAITVAPRLWLLTRRTNCRVFQQMTDLDIVKAILAEWQITPTVEASRPLKTRRYRVQYHESDYVFVCRLLEAQGITFYHRDEGGTSTLVLADAPENGRRRTETLAHHDDHLVPLGATGFRESRSVRHGKVTLSDHDYRLTNAPLLTNAASGSHPIESRLEQFLYVPGAFKYGTAGAGDTPSADDRGATRTDLEQAKRLAQNVAFAHAVQSHRFAFQTSALDVSIGQLVSITNHERAEQIPWLLVTRTVIAGSSEGEPTSSCDASDARSPYRPLLVTPAPSIHGVESAIVTGPPGEEIHTDEFGRVRVQFHWDRYGNMDETSSCWVHVNQPWAGEAFGATNLPRIGQEVIVSFMGGNPEEPIILGRYYTNMLRPPYPLPANKTQNGFKSASSPATGGYNELMFEDKAGSELVRIQAEKDMSSLIKNNEQKSILKNHAVSVGVDRAQTVGNDHTEKVGNDHTQTVGNDHTESVGGNQQSSVVGQLMQSVGADMLKSVLGNLVSAAGGERVLQTVGNLASSALTHQVSSQTSTTLQVGQSMIIMTADAIVIQSPKILLNPGVEAAESSGLGT